MNDPAAPVLTLISGSPRRRACVSLVELVEQGAHEAGVRTRRFLLSEKRVNPCIGCGACEKTGECVLPTGKGAGAQARADDYLELVDMLDSTDGLAVVAPVYFSGPTAQLKALYDRMQPYWARKYVLGMPFPPRRPSQLYVVGTGGDPHGNEPIVTISKSALQIAGFELEKVHNFVGYFAPDDRPELSADEPEDVRRRSAAERELQAQRRLCERAVESGRAFGRALIAAAERGEGAVGENE